MLVTSIFSFSYNVFKRLSPPSRKKFRNCSVKGLGVFMISFSKKSDILYGQRMWSYTLVKCNLMYLSDKL